MKQGNVVSTLGDIASNLRDRKVQLCVRAFDALQRELPFWSFTRRIDEREVNRACSGAREFDGGWMRVRM